MDRNSCQKVALVSASGGEVKKKLNLQLARQDVEQGKWDRLVI
jgi:hydrogenase maturation factor